MIADASRSGSPTGTTAPTVSGSDPRISGTPPEAVATTGVPEARASAATIPNVSRRLGWTKRLVRAIASATAVRDRPPARRDGVRDAQCRGLRSPAVFHGRVGVAADQTQGDRRSATPDEREGSQQHVDALGLQPIPHEQKLVGPAFASGAARKSSTAIVLGTTTNRSASSGIVAPELGRQGGAYDDHAGGLASGRHVGRADLRDRHQAINERGVLGDDERHPQRPRQRGGCGSIRIAGVGVDELRPWGQRGIRRFAGPAARRGRATTPHDGRGRGSGMRASPAFGHGQARDRYIR